MNLIIVQGTNAFLQSQKTFVNFCSLNPAKVPTKQNRQIAAILNQGTNFVDRNKFFDEDKMSSSIFDNIRKDIV